MICDATDPARITIRLTKFKVIKCRGGGEVFSALAQTIYTPIKRKKKT